MCGAQMFNWSLLCIHFKAKLTIVVIIDYSNDFLSVKHQKMVKKTQGDNIKTPNYSVDYNLKQIKAANLHN